MMQVESAKVPESLPFPAASGRRVPGVLMVLAGIVLPIAAMVTELVYHLCGEVFFNPLPTFLHVLLVALIPIANLWLMLSLRMSAFGRSGLLAWLNGGAIGVSAFYTVIFLPLLPIGSIAVLYFGMGFLILAPPLALAASIGLRRRLSRHAVEKPRGLWAGCFCALGLLAIIEAPSTVTRLGMKMAASDDAADHVRGVRLLRVLGDEDMMLRLCYAWPGRATDLTGVLLSMGKPVGTEKARSIYYQALGVAFNSRPAPEKGSPGWFGSRDFDGEQGGVSVAGMVPGLTLSSSRIDASIDAQAAVAYQEWILDFENQGTSTAEARAQIELPPDGVVSRLTLWVNGEEREAAFASRGKTRSAYERVVRARRDPVLVTTLGKDRVLMQCFPVPEGGGRMKVRLGITSPLAFSAAGEAYFHAPRFSERNFGISGTRESDDQNGKDGKDGQDGKEGKAVHSLWLESTGPFLSPGEGWTLGNLGDTYTLRGARSETWLARGQAFAVGGSSVNHVAWAEDSARLGHAYIQQHPETVVRDPLGELSVVVDGSRGMRPYLQGVGGAIRRAGRPVRIVLAGSDEIRVFNGSAQEAGTWLERQPCVGGQDNVAALARAWEMASQQMSKQSSHKSRATLLWIAAAQPVLLSSTASIRQSLERQADGPRLLALQVGNGPNRLLEDLETLPGVASIRFSGTLEEELESLISASPVTRTVLVRTERPQGGVPGAGKRTSNHLARLFARERIDALIEEGGGPAREKAVAMASAFRLVTPVSGAVVLENDAQYRDAGLEPSDPATVPGVPEPEMVWLALAAAAILIAQSRPLRWLRFSAIRLGIRRLRFHRLGFHRLGKEAV